MLYKMQSGKGELRTDSHATQNSHALKSSLMRIGVSPMGAIQFANGDIVTDKNDRLILAAIVSSLATGGETQHIRFPKRIDKSTPLVSRAV